MRFLSLGLDRYGRFTDRRLAFDPAARVTVVLGANEAGKTTALAAACDALFGIDERSRFNFLHDYKSMRLSAEVCATDGQRLAFARLKRRQATLVDPDTGAPLPDDALAPFLGAHDRAAFLEIFGLDQKRLRDGGRSLLAGGGDLAETLIAAAPGLSRVAGLRDRMKASAAEVFNPERRNARAVFYTGVDRLKEAQRHLQDSELRGDVVRATRAAAQEAATARQDAVAADLEATLAAAQAQKLVLAAKELRLIRAQEAERAALGPLPEVDAGFAPLAREQLAAQARAVEAEAAATLAEAQARSAREAITADPDILALAEEVTRRDEERAQVEHELASLPNRRREADAARAGLTRVAAGLGLAEVETLRARLPGPPLLARAGALVDRLRDYATRARALQDEADALARRRRALEPAPVSSREEAAANPTVAGSSPREETPMAEDPAPLKRRMEALDGAETRAAHRDEITHRHAAARTALEARLSRLGLAPQGQPWTSGDLLRRPLPDRTAAEAALACLSAAAEASARAGEARDELSGQLAQAEARRAALDASGTAPTAQAIAGARANRDLLWHQLRPALLGQRPVQANDTQEAGAFELALTAADRLADERLSESRRLADLAQTELAIADLSARLIGAEARAAATAAQLEAARADWQQLWAGSALSPTTDATALAFLRDVEGLRAAAEELDRQGAEAAHLGAACDFDRAQAEALRRDLGLPPLGAGLEGAPEHRHGPAPLRMAELRAAVAEREGAFRRQRDLARDRASLDDAAADLSERRARLDAHRQQLTAETAEVFPPLAIRLETTPDEARAALGLWQEALTLASDLATAERRIAGIEQDEARFALAMEALLGELRTAASGDLFTTMRGLRARLDGARQSAARLEAAETQLAQRRAAAEAARAARERADAQLAQSLERAGVASAAELPARIAQLEQAAACEAALAAARARLDDLKGDRAVAEIETALAGRSDETLVRDAAEAEEARLAAREARDAAIERDAAARAALEALNDGAAAATAAQEAQDAIADIDAAMARFTRDHVAARLLSLAIDRYREAHQNPIVARASTAFATLTGGRWSGIAVDYDADPPRLAAARDERLHDVSALSEGTADQLFLALRVAAIEEHARRATPLPFLADDLFVSFDEGRTAAGLRLLAELGAVTQVIVFTHHLHVAECARQALGAAAEVLEL